MFDHERLERFDPDQYRVREDEGAGRQWPFEDEDERKRVDG
jgi:hypothetical protein